MSGYRMERCLKLGSSLKCWFQLLGYLLISLYVINGSNADSDPGILVLEATSKHQGTLHSVKRNSLQLIVNENVSLYDENDIFLATEASVPAICWLSFNESLYAAPSENQTKGRQSSQPESQLLLPLIACLWGDDKISKIIVIPELVQEKEAIREFRFQIDQFGRNIYWEHLTSRGIWATSVDLQKSIKLFGLDTDEVPGTSCFAVDTYNGLLFLNQENNDGMNLSAVKLGTDKSLSFHTETNLGKFMGIALDVDNKSIFWQFQDHIYNTSYIAALGGNTTNHKRTLWETGATSMQYYKNWLFIQTKEQKVFRARSDYDSRNFLEYFTRNKSFSYSIYENRWPNTSARDPCGQLNCTHFCLPKYDELQKLGIYQCSCPPGMHIRGYRDCVLIDIIFTLNGSAYVTNPIKDQPASYVNCKEVEAELKWDTLTLHHCNTMLHFPQNDLQFDPFGQGWTSSSGNCIKFHSFYNVEIAVTIHCLSTNMSLISFAIDYSNGALFWIEKSTSSKPKYYINSIGLDPDSTLQVTSFRIAEKPSSLALDPGSSKIFWIKDSQFVQEATYELKTERKSNVPTFSIKNERILRYETGLLWWTEPGKHSSSIESSPGVKYYNFDMGMNQNNPKVALEIRNSSESIDNFNVIVSPGPSNPCATTVQLCAGVWVPTVKKAVCLCPDFTIMETEVSGELVCNSIEIIVPAHSSKTSGFQILRLSNSSFQATSFQANVPIESSLRHLTISQNRDILCWINSRGYHPVKCSNITSTWTIPSVNPNSTFLELDPTGRELFWDSGIPGNISVTNVAHLFTIRFDQITTSSAYHPTASAIDTRRNVFFWAEISGRLHIHTLHDSSQAGSVLIDQEGGNITSIVPDTQSDSLYFIKGATLQKISYRDVFRGSNITLSVVHRSEQFSPVAQLKLYEHFIFGLIPRVSPAGSAILGFNIKDSKLLIYRFPGNSYSVFEMYGPIKHGNKWSSSCSQASCEYFCFPNNNFLIQTNDSTDDNEITCKCPTGKFLHDTTQTCFSELATSTQLPSSPSTNLLNYSDYVSVTTTQVLEISSNDTTQLCCSNLTTSTELPPSPSTNLPNYSSYVSREIFEKSPNDTTETTSRPEIALITQLPSTNSTKPTLTDSSSYAKRVQVSTPYILVILFLVLVLSLFIGSSHSARIYHLSKIENQLRFNDLKARTLANTDREKSVHVQIQNIIRPGILVIKTDKPFPNTNPLLEYPGEIEGQPVLVRTVKATSDLRAISDFAIDIKILQYVGMHPNIHSLLGAEISGVKQGKIYAILQLSPVGALYDYFNSSNTKYIKISRSVIKPIDSESSEGYADSKWMRDAEGRSSCLAIQISWLKQIASGMAHLSWKQVLHGNLSTRNVLLFNGYQVKITGFALSQHPIESCKERTQHANNWQWKALEILKEPFAYSEKSDVWSYGVTAWEIFTLGKIPYAEHDSFSEVFMRALENGERPGRFNDIPKNIYDGILMPSWSENTEKRLCFANIIDRLSVVSFDSELSQNSDGYEKVQL